MNYFDEKGIIDRANRVQKIEIDSLCHGEYKIIYECHMLEPEKNKFIFKGILPGTIFPETLCMGTLKEILDFIKKTYPYMTTARWKKLDRLRDKAIQTSITINITKNEKTEKENDKAINELTEFETRYGL